MITFLLNALWAIVVGSLSGFISVLHYEKCSDNCPDLLFKRIAIYIALSLTAYLLAWFFLKKKFSLTHIVLSLVFVCSGLFINRGDILKENDYLKSKSSVATSLDFMYMSILKDKSVNGYPKQDGTGSLVKLKQWERCSIDGASCETKEKMAHMKCQSGEVYVKEQDWNKFELIPAENLQGAEPLKSMKLCQAQ